MEKKDVEHFKLPQLPRKTLIQQKPSQTLLFVSNHGQTQREVPLEIPVAVVPNCIA